MTNNAVVWSVLKNIKVKKGNSTNAFYEHSRRMKFKIAKVWPSFCLVQ